MIISDDKIVTLLGSSITIGDYIFISTIKGQKQILLVRGGETINILNCLSTYPNWFQLQKGHNVFAFDAEVGRTNLEVLIENRTVYEGV